MSIKRLIKGNTQGKTGWEHIKSWWSEDDQKPDLKALLKRQFNPLGLFLGDMVEISDLTQKENTAHEIENIICFQPVHGGDKVTRYEFKNTQSSCLEALESSEGVLYTLYHLDDEFEVDDQLVRVCEEDDYMEHTQQDEKDQKTVIRYLKDAVVESRAIIFSENQYYQVDVFGFYYSNEDESSFLTVETWIDARWMRFYVGKNINHRQILSLGSL
jgi:hypothetical protein